jgi:hypothetical protein
MKNSKNTNKITFSEYSHFTLYNTSNYKSCIEKSVLEILNKFIEVIVEYMHIILEKKVIKNEIYNDFVFERGFDTLKHVFLITFYYTKNLELTFYHTQKAYYFYVEFIEQITNDNATFLRLGSRDAIMFVYKRTIFDLNNEYKKDMEEPNFAEKNILQIVTLFIPIYKDIILYVMKYYDSNNDNKKKYINIFYSLIKNINENLYKNKINNNQIECLHIFTTLLHDKKIEINEYFKLLDNFIKKLINKKNNNESTIKTKLYDPETNIFINNDEFNKIIDYIFDISL